MQRIVDIPVTTDQGVILTQFGQIICFSASMLQGKIIQPFVWKLKWYKNKFDDKSINVGGRQRITTIGGCMILLSIITIVTSNIIMHAQKHLTQPKEPDYEALTPILYWIPAEKVKCTSHANTFSHPHEHHRLQALQIAIPALSVYERDEPINTETVNLDQLPFTKDILMLNSFSDRVTSQRCL